MLEYDTGKGCINLNITIIGDDYKEYPCSCNHDKYQVEYKDP